MDRHQDRRRTKSSFWASPPHRGIAMRNSSAVGPPPPWPPGPRTAWRSGGIARAAGTPAASGHPGSRRSTGPRRRCCPIPGLAAPPAFRRRGTRGCWRVPASWLSPPSWRPWRARRRSRGWRRPPAGPRFGRRRRPPRRPISRGIGHRPDPQGELLSRVGQHLSMRGYQKIPLVPIKKGGIGGAWSGEERAGDETRTRDTKHHRD